MVGNRVAAFKGFIRALAGPRKCREGGMPVHIVLKHMQHGGIR